MATKHPHNRARCPITRWYCDRICLPMQEKNPTLFWILPVSLPDRATPIPVGSTSDRPRTPRSARTNRPAARCAAVTSPSAIGAGGRGKLSHIRAPSYHYPRAAIQSASQDRHRSEPQRFARHAGSGSKAANTNALCKMTRACPVNTLRCLCRRRWKILRQVRSLMVYRLRSAIPTV